jgi:putative heme iron utilization protein
MSSARQHASTTSTAPPVPEPSHAERARTLLALERIGSLSTQSRRQPGYPFGSIMPYALDETGRPIFLISTMAMHTQNLAADSRASLLVSQSAADGDPLGASRVTLVGDVTTVSDADRPVVRGLYLSRHENAQYWVDFKDFAFFRMEVVDVYFVGGFGVMGWVTANEYRLAEVDPLSRFAAGIIEHMNADHADSLLLLSKVSLESKARKPA